MLPRKKSRKISAILVGVKGSRCKAPSKDNLGLSNESDPFEKLPKQKNI